MMRSISLWLGLLSMVGFADPTPPTLSIAKSSPTLVQLSWPGDSPDWHLITTTPSLSGAGTWMSVPDLPMLQLGRYVFPYPIESAARYFRLEQGGAGCLVHASPPVILPGASSTLSWCAVAGTTYQVAPGPGPGHDPVTVNGANYVVTPSAGTTYSLIASNAAGVTVSLATVTVITGGPCAYTDVTSWDCTLDFSYELTPSSSDRTYMIRHEGHLTIHLTPDFVSPLTSQFSGHATGNLQLNDRTEDLNTHEVTTLIGSGAPASGTTLVLQIDCTSNTYAYTIEPLVAAVLASSTGSQSYDSPLCTVQVRERPLPATVGSLSSSEFLPAFGFPAGSGDNFYLLTAEALAADVVVSGTRENDNVGSASVNWRFTPNH